MPVMKFGETTGKEIKEGLERRIIHGEHLMTVVLDFTHGPWKEPEAPHAHPHEQTSYVAFGEIIFICEDETPAHLKAGDVFYVPSGKQHAVQLLTEKVRLIDTFTPLREDFL